MMKSIKKALDYFSSRRHTGHAGARDGDAGSTGDNMSIQLTSIKETHVERLLHVDPTMDPDMRCRDRYRKQPFLLGEDLSVTNALRTYSMSISNQYFGYDPNEKGTGSNTGCVRYGLDGKGRICCSYTAEIDYRFTINSNVTYHTSAAYFIKITGVMVGLNNLRTILMSTTDVCVKFDIPEMGTCSYTEYVLGMAEFFDCGRSLHVPVIHQDSASYSTNVDGTIILPGGVTSTTPYPPDMELSVNHVIWLCPGYYYADDTLFSGIGISTHKMLSTHKFYFAHAHLCFGEYYFLACPSFPTIVQSFTGTLVWGVVVFFNHQVVSYTSRHIHFWAQKFAASALNNHLKHHDQLFSAWGDLVLLAIDSHDVISTSNMEMLVNTSSCVSQDYGETDEFVRRYGESHDLVYGGASNFAYGSSGLGTCRCTCERLSDSSDITHFVYDLGYNSTVHQDLVDRPFSYFNVCCCCERELVDCQNLTRLLVHPFDYGFVSFGVGSSLKRPSYYTSRCDVYLTGHTNAGTFWSNCQECGFITPQRVILKIHGELITNVLCNCFHHLGQPVDEVILGRCDLSPLSSFWSACAGVSFSGGQSTSHFLYDPHRYDDTLNYTALTSLINYRILMRFIDDFSECTSYDVSFISGTSSCCADMKALNYHSFPRSITRSIGPQLVLFKEHSEFVRGYMSASFRHCLPPNTGTILGNLHHNSSHDAFGYTYDFSPIEVVYLGSGNFYGINHSIDRCSLRRWFVNTSGHVLSGIDSTPGISSSCVDVYGNASYRWSKLHYDIVGDTTILKRHGEIVHSDMNTCDRRGRRLGSRIILGYFDFSFWALLSKDCQETAIMSFLDSPSVDSPNQRHKHFDDIISLCNIFPNGSFVIDDGYCHWIHSFMHTNPSVRVRPSNVNPHITMEVIVSFLYGEISTPSIQSNQVYLPWGDGSCASCTSYASNDHVPSVYDVYKIRFWRLISRDCITSSWASPFDYNIDLDLANDSIEVVIINDFRTIDVTAVVYGEHPLAPIMRGLQVSDNPLSVESDSYNLAGCKTHSTITTTTSCYIAYHHHINARCVLLPRVILPNDVLHGIHLHRIVTTTFRAIGAVSTRENSSRYSHDQIHDQDLSKYDHFDQVQVTTMLEESTDSSHMDVDVESPVGIRYLWIVQVLAAISGGYCHYTTPTLISCLIEWGALWGAVWLHVLSSRGVSNECRFVFGYVTNTYL